MNNQETQDAKHCGAEYPDAPNLTCLKPPDHDPPHATCLGYHPPPHDEYEWVQWREQEVPASKQEDS